MEQDWVALGAAFRVAREAAGMTQAEAGAQVGVGRDAVRTIEKGDIQRISSTVRSLALLYGWPDGAVEAVLRGGHAPKAAPATASGKETQQATYASGMPQRVQTELSEGSVMDTDVIDLSVSGADAQLVMVVKGLPDDATPEQRRELLTRWARAQRRIRAIVEEELS